MMGEYELGKVALRERDGRRCWQKDGRVGDEGAPSVGGLEGDERMMWMKGGKSLE